MKSLQGYFLIASPKLIEPNFYHSVVFIVQHSEEGALGLIVNRPVETTIDEVWDQVSQSPCLSDAPLHQGGPCEGALMALHGEESLSQTQIIPGVCFTTDKEDLEHLVASDDEHRPVKFFVGYSGWSPAQLEGELEAGGWLVAPATAAQVFGPTEELWDMLRRRISLQSAYPWLKPELIPDDPTVN